MLDIFCFLLKRTLPCNVLTGKTAQESVEIGLNMMERRVGGDGGCIALDARGNIGIYFTVEGMAWAYCRDGQLHHGIYKGEDVTEVA